MLILFFTSLEVLNYLFIYIRGDFPKKVTKKDKKNLKIIKEN